jgi:hypothetical protein
MYFFSLFSLGNSEIPSIIIKVFGFERGNLPENTFFKTKKHFKKKSTVVREDLSAFGKCGVKHGDTELRNKNKVLHMYANIYYPKSYSGIK